MVALHGLVHGIAASLAGSGARSAAFLREVLVLAGFAAVSLVFARPILGDLGTACLCDDSTDPSIAMWSLVWWPHALATGTNPLFTDAVWAPDGSDLSWVTTVPSAALLGYPLLRVGGPVVAYNALMLAAAPLAAYAAYRLCRYVTGALVASLAGGYAFGFSTYMLGHSLGHLNLVFVFPVPLAVLLAVAHLDGGLSRRAFLSLLVPLLLLQFGFSTELFATTLAFGALALAVAYLVSDASGRRPLRALAHSLAVAIGLVALLLSPFLVRALAHAPAEPLNSRTENAIDVLNPVVATPLTRFRLLEGTGEAIMRNASEAGGYLGLPLLAVVGLVLVRERRMVRGRVLGAVFLAATFASFGPWLWFAGHRSPLPNPFGAYVVLPVVGHALPSRFILYAFLAAAVALAVWLARPGGSAWARWPLGVAAVLALLPNPAFPWFQHDVPDPPFFRDGRWRAALTPGDIAVVLPYGHRGFSMLWQARTEMGFRMAGGYLNARVPAGFREERSVRAFLAGRPAALDERQLRDFLTAKRVRAILVGPPAHADWRPLLLRLDPTPRTLGGVEVYDVQEPLSGRPRSLGSRG
ncbi:MAG: hypothetical protein M3322_07545 [Actinomycetota bacterium]|nr:hypothetical protein [Actinomycetota bacterium]